MNEIQELQDLIFKADAAGDKESVQFLLSELERIQSNSQQQAAPQPQLSLTEKNSQAIENLRSRINKPASLSALDNNTNFQANQANSTIPSLEQPVQEQPVETQVEEEGGFLDGLQTAASTGLTIASSTLAEPIAGLAGLGTSVGYKLGNLLGLTDKEATAVGEKVINNVRDFITVEPNAGAQEVLGKVAEGIEAITPDALKGSQEKTGKFFADIGENLFGEEGRALGGAFGETLFEAGLIAGGGAAGKAVGKGINAGQRKIADIKDGFAERADAKLTKEADKLISENTPSLEQINEKVGELYNTATAQGVKIRPTQVKKLFDEINKRIKENEFFGEESAKNMTTYLKNQEAKIQDRIDAKQNFTIKEIDNIRSQLGQELASKTSTDIDKRAAGVGRQVVNEFFDKINEQIANQDLTGDLANARNLFRSKAKLEKVNTAIELSKIANNPDQAIKSEFRKLARREIDKPSGDFSAKEMELLKDISAGKQSTFSKFLEKHSKNPLTRIATGYMFGGSPTGAALGTVIGELHTSILNNITRKNVKLLKQLEAAGENANEVVKAYIKTTPKKERNSEDIVALLLDPKLNKRTFDSIKPIDAETRRAKKTATILKDLVEEKKAEKAGALATQTQVGDPDRESGLPNIRVSTSERDELLNNQGDN